MKKRFLGILVVTALLASMLTSFIPIGEVSAGGPPEWAPKGPTEKLPPGWQRLDPYTKVHRLRNFTDAQGKRFVEVEAEIGSLPTTLDDNKTLIDTNWYLLTDKSGQSYFQTGDNFFTARVLEGRVSVEDKNGRLSVWNPVVTIGNETFTGGTAKITNDLISEDYEGNCLLWEYGSYSDGWWIFGSSAKVERYLRVIEGHISELWILPIDPKANIVIDLNESVEEEYGADITWLKAYDADNRPLQVTKDKSGNYVISATEFKDKVFPITIDPTEDFRTEAADDGEILYWEAYATYATVRNRTSGWAYSTTDYGEIGQAYLSVPYPTYYVMRFAVMWNTSSIPDDAVITTGKLYLSYGTDYSYTDFYIIIQSGMPTYPHRPLTNSDYYYLNYSGNGGQVHTSNRGFYIPLNSTGMSWVNKTGWTKFMIRSSRDIAGNTPTQKEYIEVRTREYSYSYAPYLYVAWIEPVDPPSVTTYSPTAKAETSISAKGYLSDDGGEACSVRFQYDTSTAYSYATAWESGYTTGQFFYKTIYGLTPGELYYYRAQATNVAGTATGSGVVVLTYPYRPDSFTATGEENQVALTWSKGSGADKTMIRRAEGSYPTSPTSGTQIYFDTGTSHDDTTTVNGVTYYYRAWSYATEGGYSEYSQSYRSDYASSYTLGVPTVTTNAATDVQATTATINLYLNDLGGYATTNVWFQWYAPGGSWPDNTTTSTQKTAPGSHSAGISSLTTETLYHFRAVAQNTAGTVYGADKTFTTAAPCAPTMLTQSATGVQLTSVTLNAKVTDDGDDSVTAGFEYGLTTDYELGSTPTTSGLTTNDTYYYNLGNLEPNTTYHYRAIGENTAGVGYGGDIEFTTATPTAPTLNTGEATEIGANQATLNGNLTGDGGVACEVRFQYGTTDAYGIDTGWMEGYTTGMSFNQLISDLVVGETYHFRAQAKNAGGTTNGADKTFTTKFTPPINFVARAVSSSTVKLEWLKAGDQTYVRYKQAGYPIDREDGLVVPPGKTPDEEASVSGLDPGTTYYFRAWSWREGDVWAEGYAEDVATTPPVTPGITEDRPETIIEPDVPSKWFHDPDGTALSKVPFVYEQVNNWADSIGMPHGSLWMVIAIVLTIVAWSGVYGFAATHEVKESGVAAMVAGGLMMAACSGIGMVPLWFILIYLVLGGGFQFVMRRL